MPALMPLMLGAAALFLVFSKTEKKKKKPAEVAADCVDPGMPVEFENALNTLLADDTIPAGNLIAAAQLAEKHNFKRAAQCLRAAAEARGGSQEPTPGFDPFDPTKLGIPVIPTFPTVPTIPGGLPGIPPGGVEPAIACVLDSHMGAVEQDQTRALLGAPVTAAELLAAAQIATSMGFPAAAACLQAEAAKRAAGAIVPSIPGFDPLDPSTWPAVLVDPTGPLSGSMQFIIRSGDRPVGIAQYYTGAPMRFREWDPLNPQLGAFTGGVPPYPNWQVGVAITLPPDWNATAKPIPPTGL